MFMFTRLAPVTIPAISNVVVGFNSFEKRRHFVWRAVRSIELLDSDGRNAVTNRKIMYLDCNSTSHFDPFCLNGMHARAVDIEVTLKSMKITIKFTSHRKKLRLRARVHVEFLRLINELRSACPDLHVRVVDVNVRSSVFSSHNWTSRAVEDDGRDIQTGDHGIPNAGNVIPPRAVGPIDLFEHTPYRLQPPMVPGHQALDE